VLLEGRWRVAEEEQRSMPLAPGRRKHRADGTISPSFLVKMKLEAVSSSSSEEVGATTAFSGIWLATFASEASFNKSSLLKRANILSAKKTQKESLTFHK